MMAFHEDVVHAGALPWRTRSPLPLNSGPLNPGAAQVARPRAYNGPATSASTWQAHMAQVVAEKPELTGQVIGLAPTISMGMPAQIPMNIP